MDDSEPNPSVVENVQIIKQEHVCGSDGPDVDKNVISVEKGADIIPEAANTGDTNVKDNKQHNKEIVEARKAEQMFVTAGGQLDKTSP